MKSRVVTLAPLLDRSLSRELSQKPRRPFPLTSNKLFIVSKIRDESQTFPWS